MGDWDVFDRELAESLSQLPPPETAVRDVTPWRQAMGHIVLGLCLTCFTLNFWYLQYLLPAIGAVELYLGFRTLRNNGHWFHFGFIIILCKAVLLYTNFLLQATPFGGFLPFGLVGTGLTLLLFVSLWQGLRQAAVSLGRTPDREPAKWAVVWYGVMIALALLWPQPGWLVALGMLFAFYRIVKALRAAVAELEDWGYDVTAAPVRLGGGVLRGLYLGTLAVVIVLLSLISNHIPVEGTPIEQNFDSQQIAIQAHLLDLGFPEEYLALLPGEELTRLENAVYSIAPYTYKDDRIGSQSGRDLIDFYPVYVQLGDDTIRVYEFFRLRTEAPLPSNWAMMTQLEHGVRDDTRATDITSAILWSKGGVPYRADLEVAPRTHNGMLGSQPLPSSLFSYPYLSRDRMGYMAYTPVTEVSSHIYSSVLRCKFSAYGSLYPYQGPDALPQTDAYAQSYSIFQLWQRPASK